MKRDPVPASEPDISPELRDHLDQMLKRYKEVRAKEQRLRLRQRGRIRPLRLAIHELEERLEARVERLVEERDAITREFLQAWEQHFPDLPRVKMPSAFVSKRHQLDVSVRNKRELIDLLDRIDRLDLVDYVFDLRKIRRLIRRGVLDEVPRKALKVRKKLGLQVMRRKKED